MRSSSPASASPPGSSSTSSSRMGFLLQSSNWPLEWPLAAIVVAALLYLVGGRQSATASAATKRWRGASFYAGLTIAALAISSPIDAYADRLFWVHMVQHVLLMMVAPPLLLVGRPWPRLLRPLPLNVRRPLARAALAGPTLAPLRHAFRRLASPLPAFAVFNGTLLVWHLPLLYDLTLRDGPVHDLEHALFFGTALLFWVHLLPGASGRPQLSDAARALYGTAALARQLDPRDRDRARVRASLRRIRNSRSSAGRTLGTRRPTPRGRGHVGARLGPVLRRARRRRTAVARSRYQRRTKARR